MTTRITSHVITRNNKIPFNMLADDGDLESDGKSVSHGRDGPRFKNIVDKFVGNLITRKHRRYAASNGHPEYKHSRLYTSVRHTEEQHNPDDLVLDDEYQPQRPERWASMEEIGELCRHEFPSSAFMGRRRSRSESDLVATEIFVRRPRRAAICEEMERGIFMENGNTLRKCRKNLVLNQILENLSLL